MIICFKRLGDKNPDFYGAMHQFTHIIVENLIKMY